MEFLIFFGILIIAIALIIYGLQGKVKFNTVKKDPKTGFFIEVDENGNPVYPEYIKEKVTSKIEKKKILHYSSNGFWHGQKGLALTFWGFFVGGNILLNVLTVIIAITGNQTLIVINLILTVIWNVLAIMGVFNAANIYKAEKIKQGLPYTAATIAKVAVVLLILSAIGNSISR